MTQQVFAQYLDMSPATLSSIYSGRTKPTLNIIEAIKRKFPDISVDWLLFGVGSMYPSATPSAPATPTPPDRSVQPASSSQESVLDFFVDTNRPADPQPRMGENPVRTPSYPNSVKSTRLEFGREEVKVVDKPQRRVIEIRVFYDDQTWDTFVPAKK